jgi:hypothetical protein
LKSCLAVFNGTRRSCLMKKTRVKKSRDTVPLRNYSAFTTYIIEKIYSWHLAVKCLEFKFVFIRNIRGRKFGSTLYSQQCWWKGKLSEDCLIYVSSKVIIIPFSCLLSCLVSYSTGTHRTNCVHRSPSKSTPIMWHRFHTCFIHMSGLCFFSQHAQRDSQTSFFRILFMWRW